MKNILGAALAALLIPFASLICASSPTPAPVTGRWETQAHQGQFEVWPTVILKLSAQNPVTGWVRTRTPVLVLRCQDGQTDGYIDMDMKLSVEDYKYVYVHLQLDDGPSQRQRMNASTDGVAMFFPDIDATISALLDASTLVLEITPFNAGPARTSFELSGLSEAIKPLQEACP
jgi:type VI secretion system protein VasI